MAYLIIGLPFLPWHYENLGSHVHCPVFCGLNHLESSGGMNLRFLLVHDVEYILGSRQSLASREIEGQGLTESDFNNKFWDCTIGGPDLSYQEKKEKLELYSYISSRLVMWVDVRLP